MLFPGNLIEKGTYLLTHRVTSRAGYAPIKSNQKSDSTYSSLNPSPEGVDFEIPLPPERDSTSPTPTAPKPESMKETRGELLSALVDCERSLTQARGLEIVENTTATIRLAQRYRAHVRHEDWEDEKKLRRDAVDVLFILRRITEQDDNEVTEEEKSVIQVWCNDIKARVDRDDEVRREMWERAAAWMEGNWENNEWGIAIPDLTNFRTISFIPCTIRPLGAETTSSVNRRIPRVITKWHKTLSNPQRPNTLLPPTIRTDNSFPY